MTHLQRTIADEIIRARVYSCGGWARVIDEVDGVVHVAFGDVHHGVEERALGHYLVRTDGTVSKYVGV